MKRFLAALTILPFLFAPAMAQQSSWLWWGTNSTTTVPVSVANPLPVTATGGLSVMKTDGSNATAAALGNIVTLATGCNDATKVVKGDGTCGTVSAGMATDASNAGATAVANLLSAAGSAAQSAVGPWTFFGGLSVSGAGKQILVRDGFDATTPQIGVTGSTNTGTSYGGGGAVYQIINGTAVFAAQSQSGGTRWVAQLEGTKGVFGWCNGDAASCNVDAGISRDGAGVIDVGNGSPQNASGGMKMSALTASGTITFAGVTTGTNADFACFAAGGVMTLQSTACTISSMRFKNIMGPAPTDPVSRIEALKPVAFTMRDPYEHSEGDFPNPDWNYDKPQVGLLAEDVAKSMPMCAIYEQDGKTPKSYRQECVIAELVGAVKAQQRQIAALVAEKR